MSDCLTWLVNPQLFTPLPVEQVDDPDIATVTAIQTTEPTLIQLSTDDIHCLQRSNAYCKRIFASFDTDPRTHRQFTTKDGILYRLMQVSGVTHLALVVPQSLALTLVCSVHLEFQHPGASCTYDALATRVYWRDMWTMVHKYVHGCNVWQLPSLKQHTFPSKHDRPPNAPWTRITIDCIGFTHNSSQGHVGIMTGICLATQYPWAELIHAKSTECVQAAIMKILATAPNVQEIVSDNSSEFGKIHFDTFLNKLNIHHQRITLRHPESNGVLERFHRYLNLVVRNAALVNPTACWLPAVMGALCAYCTLPHTASGESPHFLVTGQDPTYAIDTLLPTLTRDFRNPKHGLVDLAQMQLAFGIARRNTILAHLCNAKSPTVVQPLLEVGDLVHVMHRNCAKHNPLWNPGFRITCKISDTCFKVFHSGTRTRLVRNVQHLKLAKPVELILDNTSVNILPSHSQLYMRDEHLLDLQWLFTKHKVQLSDLFKQRAMQTTKPRDNEVLPQLMPPTKQTKCPLRPSTPPPQPVAKQSTRRRTIVRHQDPDFAYTCRVRNVSCTKLLY